MRLFVAAEVLLLLAIPILGFVGYRALLESNDGEFIESVAPDEPGYRVYVDPSPLMVVATVEDDSIVNLAVLTRASAESVGGGVVVVGPDLVLDGRRLGDLEPATAAELLGEAMRLDLGPPEVMDAARWAALAGDQEWSVSNPDPITADNGETYPVGEIAMGGADVPTLLGGVNPAYEGGALAFRQAVVWEALVSKPADGTDPVAEFLTPMAQGAVAVEPLPVNEDGAPGPEPDPEAVEAVVNQLVPFPRASVPEERIAVRVLAVDPDAGLAEAEQVATELGHRGYEIVEIGIAAPQSEPTQLIVPATDWPGIPELTALMDADKVEVDASDDVVTLYVGADTVLASENRALPDGGEAQES